MNTKITELSEKVAKLSLKLGESRTENHSLRTKINESDIQHDDLENYGRRMNVRIEGIVYDREETQDQLFDKVKACLADVDIPIAKADIVRFHRSGNPVRKDGRCTAQTIVKFARWEHRSKAHYANKKARLGGKSFRIHNDLTKRRFVLLSKAREQLAAKFPSTENPAFAYTDVNSNLKIRRGERVFELNTDHDLSDALRQLAD